MSLRKTWNDLKQVINENKISSILLLTMLLGVISTAFTFPDDVRITHVDGHEGHTLPYAFYFIFHYLIGFAFVAGLLINIRTKIDTWMIQVYLFWDFIGFLSYLYQGWPEPKNLIILGFTTSFVLFVGLNIFKDG